MNHNSNGGIDKPNLGINYPSIALGAYYIIDKDKNLDDYIYTGDLDEKDGISRDPLILTKSNE